MGNSNTIRDAAAAGDGGSGATSPGRTLRRALAHLREARPPYFKACEDAVVASRRAVLARRFNAALSSGGVGSGGGRALDLAAHDDVRYIGDMLAWVHAAVAEESDVLSAVFGVPSNSDPARDSAAEGAHALGDAAAAQSKEAATLVGVDVCLAAVADALSRPLSVRIDAIVVSASGGAAASSSSSSSGTGPTSTSPLVVVFRIVDLLSFYRATLHGLLADAPFASTEANADQALPVEGAIASQPVARSSSSGLLAALAACHARAVERFGVALAAHAARTRSASPSYPSDLTASQLVLDTCRTLDDVLRAYGVSLAAAAEAKLAAAAGASAARRGAPAPAVAAITAPATVIQIDAILDALIVPLIDACRGSAEGLRVSDTAVFMLNNLSALGGVLSSHAFTASWVQRLAGESSAWEEALVQQAANDILSACGLLEKLSVMRAAAAAAHGGTPGLPMAAISGLQPHELRPVVNAYYAELAAPSLVSLYDRVSNPRVRSRVRRDTAAVLASAYTRLYEDVVAPTNGYAEACDVSALLRRTPKDVEALLDLT